MPSVTKIEKIVIDVRGEKLKLTPEQARELRDILNDTLGKKEYIPYPVYPQPWYRWDVTPYWSSSGCTITCSL